MSPLVGRERMMNALYREYYASSIVGMSKKYGKIQVQNHKMSTK
jgi:hypothetical protein